MERIEKRYKKMKEETKNETNTASITSDGRPDGDAKTSTADADATGGIERATK